MSSRYHLRSGPSGRNFGSYGPPPSGPERANQGYSPSYPPAYPPYNGPPPQRQSMSLLSQHQPPTTVTSDMVDKVNKNVEASTATLDTLRNMLESATPTTEFEKMVATYLGLLTAQLRDIKVDVSVINDRLLKHEDLADRRFADINHGFGEVEDIVVKTEQYSRRDTITVAGLSKPNENETSADLGNRIATTLSKCGVRVKVDDFSAFHRNSNKSKTVKTRDGADKVIPPSVTARFKSINLKDEVIRNYKNYDTETSRSKEVRIYHSLTPHYSHLRRNIELFFKEGDNEDNLQNPHKVQPGTKELKWCKYQSPSSGLVLKLKSDEYIKGVHSWHDFCDKYYKVVILRASY